MQWHVADAIIVGIAIPISLYLFGKALYRKYQLMKACASIPDPIEDHLTRIKEILTIFLGQKKLFQDLQPGIMHALIFWGFCILLVRAVTMFGMAFAGFDFHLPGLGPGTAAGRGYSLLKDIANVAVLAMVLFALIRRYILRIPRLLNTPGALFVLVMIFCLMASDLIFDGILHASSGAETGAWSPVGSMLGAWFAPETGTTGGPPAVVGHIGFLFHCLGILVFLVYLPMGKHMHIITSIFNVYLRPLHRSGRLTKLDLEDESIEVYGTSQIEHLTWKEVLDLYTCTECGRCNDVCPAQRTGKELAPREITSSQKHFLLDEEAVRLLSGNKEEEPEKELVGDVVKPEEIWACTTCQACEQACPVNIAYVQRINSMRRSEVLMKAKFPSELKRIFRGMETNANPWGLGASKRMEWAEDLEVPLFEKSRDAEFLLFLGCAASFDDRAQKVSRSLIRFLKTYGISYGILGENEQCCGETPRRLGEEALGQTLIETNCELFAELGVKKILVLCPHCYNTFKNEYPDFGGHYEVVHHSQLIQDLIRREGMALPRDLEDRVVIHDSCYMGRVNNVYAPPREIVRSIEGLDLVEHKESRERGFCCGAGGGRFWMEEKEPRINHERVKQLASTNAGVIATSCPYCLRMLEDGVSDLKMDGIRVRDVVEILDMASGS